MLNEVELEEIGLNPATVQGHQQGNSNTRVISSPHPIGPSDGRLAKRIRSWWSAHISMAVPVDADVRDHFGNHYPVFSDFLSRIALNGLLVELTSHLLRST